MLFKIVQYAFVSRTQLVNCCNKCLQSHFCPILNYTERLFSSNVDLTKFINH